MPSASRSGQITHTLITKTVFNDSVCTCEGFQFRGYCRHTEEHDAQYCRWFELLIPSTKHIDECPACGAEAMDFNFAPEFDE